MAEPFRTAEVPVLLMMCAGVHMELLLYSFVYLGGLLFTSQERFEIWFWSLQ